MTRFMATTAIASALLAGTAFAENVHSDLFRAQAETQEIQASEFIGMRVYASEAEIEGEVDILSDGWEDVGEINDIIIGRDGSVEAVLVDLGGFLGLGERQVAMNMSSIKFVSDNGTDDADDFFLVIPASRANLEEAPEYSWSMNDAEAEMEQAGNKIEDAAEDVAQNTEEAADDAGVMIDNAVDNTAAALENAGDKAEVMAEETMAEAEEAADDAAAMAKDAGQEIADAVSLREGYVVASAADIKIEELTGARVYDGNNEWIGEIDEVLMSDSGALDATIVDVGGFMGLGEKPVKLSIDRLDFLLEDGGDDVLVYTNLTEEELEAMPTYEN